MTINQIQDELIEDFELFDDQLDKTQYIIDLGKKLKPIGDDLKTDDNLIQGCQSKVWLNCEANSGKVIFEADAEPTAQISKGLASLLVKILSDQKAEDVATADLYFIEKIGMSSLVTSRRSGGLASMVLKIKEFAKQIKP